MKLRCPVCLNHPDTSITIEKPERKPTIIYCSCGYQDTIEGYIIE